MNTKRLPSAKNQFSYPAKKRVSALFIATPMWIFLSLCLFFLNTNSWAQSSSGIPERLMPVEAFMKKGDCESAWNFTWNLAKQNDKDALALLVRLVEMGLSAPGNRSPEENLADKAYSRQILALFVYGSQSNQDFGIPQTGPHEVMPLLIDETVKLQNLGKEGQQLASCFKQSANYSECVTLAVSNRLIPPFEDFVKAQEMVVQKFGGAKCRKDVY